RAQDEEKFTSSRARTDARRRGGSSRGTHPNLLRRDRSLLLFGLGKFTQDHTALHRGEMVDEQHAVEMIHLVLDAGREQVLGVEFADFVFIIEIAQLDRPGPFDVISSSDTHSNSGLAMRIGCGFSPSRATSSTMTRFKAPTCGAARPMPGAAYMVSSIESISRRVASSTRTIGFALPLRRGSGAVMIGSNAMTALYLSRVGGRVNLRRSFEQFVDVQSRLANLWVHSKTHR